MRKAVVLSVALLAALLWSLPAEAAKAGAGRAPVTGGTGTGTSGYVPPVVEERGAVRVHLVGLLHDGKQLPGGRHFTTRTLRDLLLVVEYRALPAGAHTQRLKLFAPDGALYQQFTTEFAVGTGRAPHWLPVETRLPVGGTWITEHSLYGTWRLEVYLDAASRPTESHPFTLTK
jgi:hypothetical protein